MSTHTRQVEHQRCSRTGRVQKISKNVRKNTIFNEHPVPSYLDLIVLNTDANANEMHYSNSDVKTSNEDYIRIYTIGNKTS